MMTNRSLKFFLPILLFLLFIGDLQVSTLLTNLTPFHVSVACFQTIILLMIFPQIVSSQFSIILGLYMGFVYDIYYYNALGIAICLMPFVAYLAYYFFESIQFNRVSATTVTVVLIFIFEMVSYLLARLFQLTNLSIFIFTFNHLFFTLLFNGVLIFVLFPLLNKFINTLNK